MNTLKTAFVFPGQGSQYVGMGKDYYQSFLIAREIYEEANDILNIDIKKLCFDGLEDDLQLTENAQPAILTTSIAILRVLASLGYSCDCTAGLSLGEYSALVNSKVLSFSDALRTVRKRGIYMQNAVPRGTGKMCAIVGLSEEKLAEVLSHSKQFGLIEIANYNSNDQIVLSGEKPAIKAAIVKAKEIGAIKALQLLVSAPFHSSMMRPAGSSLDNDFKTIIFNNPSIPYIANVNAEIITSNKDIPNLLVQQVSQSVLWSQSVHLMLKMGVDKFIEVGPGTVLTKLINSIAERSLYHVKSISVDSVENLENLKVL